MKTKEQIAKELEELKSQLGKIEEIKQKDFMITEACNVMAIMPFKKGTELGDEINIDGLGTFQKYKEDVLFKMDKNFKIDSFLLSKSKYSYEFLTMARKTANIFNRGNDLPEFYVHYEDGIIKEDFPCLIRFDNLVFLLAPRVEE